MISAHGVVISVVLACSLAGAAVAQEEGQPVAAPDSDAVPLPGVSPDELDVLVAPVALFPDALLSQILMASTYPLDVVMAKRLFSQNSELAPADRSALAEAQPWDSSVIALAAGFPDVVSRMSEHIDWTQRMGDSVLVDTDAVLAAIQRMRQQALDMGNLATNEAQVAFIAYPADYGTTGIMTFMVAENGTLMEANLGETTIDIAAAIESFNPDSDWQVSD